MNLFEYATRNKIMFETPVGTLDVIRLWDLDLEKLNDVAVKIDEQLSSLGQKNFINKNVDETRRPLEKQLEIVTYIIDYKITMQERSKKAMDTKAQRQKILEALDRKRENKIDEMSEDDLIEELNKLAS